jgi:hypothetical protein
VLGQDKVIRVSSISLDVVNNRQCLLAWPSGWLSAGSHLDRALALSQPGYCCCCAGLHLGPPLAILRPTVSAIGIVPELIVAGMTTIACCAGLALSPLTRV